MSALSTGAVSGIIWAFRKHSVPRRYRAGCPLLREGFFARGRRACGSGRRRKMRHAALVRNVRLRTRARHAATDAHRPRAARLIAEAHRQAALRRSGGDTLHRLSMAQHNHRDAREEAARASRRCLASRSTHSRQGLRRRLPRADRRFSRPILTEDTAQTCLGWAWRQSTCADMGKPHVEARPVEKHEHAQRHSIRHRPAHQLPRWRSRSGHRA